MKREWIIYAVLYIICWTVTAAGINRDLQYQFATCGPNSYRETLALAIGWSALPAAWIVGPFVTGFYEHGFGFSPRSDCLEMPNAE